MGYMRYIYLIFCIITDMQRKMISVGISFPIETLKKIDEERGDVSRSKYLLKIIERLSLENDEKR